MSQPASPERDRPKHARPPSSDGGVTPASPDDSPTGILDRNAALQRLGGNEQLFADLAGFYLDDSPELLAQIREGLRRGNAETVGRAAHSLKGLAANFDASAAGDAAARVEEVASADDLEGAAAELPRLTREVDRLRCELQRYVGRTS